MRPFRHSPGGLPRARPASLPAVLVCAALACALAGGQGLPASAAPARSFSPGLPASPAAARQVLLITGDRLIVGPHGQARIALRPARRREVISVIRSGGQVLALPAEVVPYLGHGLSPDLFNVGDLERAESGGRLPVRVTFTGTRPDLAGLTVTRSAVGVADGYLTAASARAFGAALLRRSPAGRPGGPLGRGVSISLAGAAPPPPAPPAGPAAAARQAVLTIKGTTLWGKPNTGGSIFVASVDNPRHVWVLPENFYHGVARFKVPDGRYWAVGIFGWVDEQIVVRPQFTVRGRHTTVRMSAKSATSEFVADTARRASTILASVSFVRSARAGSTGYLVGWSGLNAWVSPTRRKPALGNLNTQSQATLLSPRGVSPGYAYNLYFPGPAGIVPPQHFVVGPANLAAVTERYYQDPPAKDTGWLAQGGLDGQTDFSPIVAFPMPGVLTQYLSPGRRILWQLSTLYNIDGPIVDLIAGDTDDDRAYAPGQRQTQDWNDFPLHPQPDTTPPDTALGGPASVIPTPTSAARLGNRLELLMTPFSDNQAGHLGPGFENSDVMVNTGSYQVDQDGREIAHGDPLYGIPFIKLSPRPSVLRFVLTAHRSSSLFPLSPSSRTVWTWRSAPDPAARVPAPWYCAIRHGRVRQCAVQPLMTLDYAVRGMSLTGHTRPGPQLIEVTAGHVQLGGSAAITGATAQVSFNDGRTWRRAAVTAGGGGQFRVGFSAPPGVLVTLRVGATDAAGGSITETILRGYAVSRAAAPGVG